MMKKIVMGLAVAAVTSFAAPAFAEDAPPAADKPAGEAKPAKKAKKAKKADAPKAEEKPAEAAPAK